MLVLIRHGNSGVVNLTPFLKFRDKLCLADRVCQLVLPPLFAKWPICQRGDMIEAISLVLFKFDSACETVCVSMCYMQFNMCQRNTSETRSFPLSPRGPFVHLAMDFYRSFRKKTNEKVLFSPYSQVHQGWVEAFPTTHCDAKTVAKILVKETIPNLC